MQKFLKSTKKLTFLFLLASLILGCISAQTGPKSNSKSTVDNHDRAGEHSVTSGTLSPYEPENYPVVFPESTVNISLKSFKVFQSNSVSPIQLLSNWRTKNGLSLVVTIRKDGLILAEQEGTAESSLLELGRLGPGIEMVDFSPTTGVIGYRNARGLSVYSIVERKVIATFNRLDTRMTSLKFTPDGDAIFISGADGMVYTWRFGAELRQEEKSNPEKLLHRYAGSGSVVSAVSVHPLGRVFFSGDWRGDVVVWQRYGTDKYGGKYDRNMASSRYFTGKIIRNRIRVGTGVGIDLMEVDKKGQYLVIGLQDGTIELWKVKGTKFLTSIKAHNGPLYQLAIKDSENKIATVGKDGFVRLWSIESKEVSVEQKVGKKKRQKLAALQGSSSGQEESGSELETVLRKEIQYELKQTFEQSSPNAQRATFGDRQRIYIGSKTGELSRMEF